MAWVIAGTSVAAGSVVDQGPVEAGLAAVALEVDVTGSVRAGGAARVNCVGAETSRCGFTGAQPTTAAAVIKTPIARAGQRCAMTKCPVWT
jgi:hypothetical protein